MFVLSIALTENTTLNPLAQNENADGTYDRGASCSLIPDGTTATGKTRKPRRGRSRGMGNHIPPIWSGPASPSIILSFFRINFAYSTIILRPSSDNSSNISAILSSPSTLPGFTMGPSPERNHSSLTLKTPEMSFICFSLSLILPVSIWDIATSETPNNWPNFSCDGPNFFLSRINLPIMPLSSSIVIVYQSNLKKSRKKLKNLGNSLKYKITSDIINVTL